MNKIEQMIGKGIKDGDNLCNELIVANETQVK